MKEKIKELETLQKRWIKHYKKNGYVRDSVALSHYWEGKMKAIKEIIDLLKNQKQSGV